MNDNGKNRLLHLLKQGGQYSTIEIIKLLNIAHPQSAIRNLREEGHPIVGIWYKRTDGTRYKKYSYDYNRTGQLPVH